VTIGPWDPMAAGAPGRGGLRASDADREQVIDALKAAFVQGHLSKDALEVRVGLALASRTYAELTAITAEIPAVQIRTPLPPSKPAWADTGKRVDKKVAAWGACGIILPPALGAAFLTYYGGYLVLLLFAFIGLLVSAGPSAPRWRGPLPVRGRR
jgi:DUF1707 SHOCT-like domain